MALISRETSEALDRVLDALGVDRYNRFLFGRAAERCGGDVFALFVESLDVAIKEDPRRGTNGRIRERIERERAARGRGPGCGSE